MVGLGVGAAEQCTRRCAAQLRLPAPGVAAALAPTLLVSACTQAARKGMSAADFFHRFPQLHSFLLRQLAAAAEQLEGASSTGSSCRSRGASSPAARMHPSLFPILALLSRLRPSHYSKLSGSSATSGGADTTASPQAFAPVVQRCAAAAPAAVRRLAAEALPPLLPQESHPAAAAALAAAVAATVAQQQQQHLHAAAGEAVPPEEPRISLNAAHGKLLQLRELLLAAGAAGGAASDASPAIPAILSAVAQPLASAAWASDLATYPCAAVSFEYLRLAAAAVGLPGALAHAGAAAWLSAVQEHCRAAVARYVGWADPAGPWLVPRLCHYFLIHCSFLKIAADARLPPCLPWRAGLWRQLPLTAPTPCSLWPTRLPPSCTSPSCCSNSCGGTSRAVQTAPPRRRRAAQASAARS